MDRSCLKNFVIQKVCCQLFCFSTNFNFDYRFLEGMTGAIFEMWSWRVFETFFHVWSISEIDSHLSVRLCK